MKHYKEIVRALIIFLFLVITFSCSNNEESIPFDNYTISLSSANLTDKGYFDGMLYYKIISNSGKAVEVSYSEKNVNIVQVPQTIIIDNIKYTVTGIGEECFFRCQNLTLIQLPKTILSIGVQAFRECKQLNSIDLPDNINFIKSGAFMWCTNLTSISIPDNIVEISDHAFYICEKLRIIKIGQKVNSIRNNAFSECRNISDVYFYSETIPSCDGCIDYSNIYDVTLHVPSIHIEKYKSTYPWSKFGSLIPLE